MTLEQYWAATIKQWRLIVVCFLLVGLGAYVGSKLTTPLYQSTALVQIAILSGNNQADYNSLLASDQLVQTEAQLAISDPVLREVASHYPGLTVTQLEKEVSSTPRLNTQLFEVDVLDPSPSRAAALANDVAATLIRQQTQVIQQDSSQSQQQIQLDLQQTQQQIDTTTNQINALQAKPGNEVQVNTLQTRLNALQQHYTQWETLLAQLELSAAQNSGFLRIVQPAQPALVPARPNVLFNTGGGLLGGLLLGLLLAVLFEQLDTRVRTAEMLTQLLDWPVLATVWRIKSSKKKRRKGKSTDSAELVNPKGGDANVESYRILRTSIGFSALDKPLRSIMVASAVPYDGKSTIAANLAIYMAKAGKSTLLVDADLRRPTLHEKFDLPADKMGLSNAVLAFSQLQLGALMSSTQPLSTPLPVNISLNPFMHSVDIPNLLVMPSGPLPPNPPELLDSKAMECLFTAISNCGAEVVIFDTPPLLGLSDASTLASKVDGAVVVIDITRANKKSLKQTKALLKQAGTRVLGCVVNKQRRSRKDTAYGYYYYYRVEESDHSTQNGKVPSIPTTSPLSSQQSVYADPSFLDNEKGG